MRLGQHVSDLLSELIHHGDDGPSAAAMISQVPSRRKQWYQQAPVIQGNLLEFLDSLQSLEVSPESLK